MKKKNESFFTILAGGYIFKLSVIQYKAKNLKYIHHVNIDSSLALNDNSIVLNYSRILYLNFKKLFRDDLPVVNKYLQISNGNISCFRIIPIRLSIS